METAESQFQLGDFLTISCPFREATVTALESSVATLRRPWRRGESGPEELCLSIGTDQDPELQLYHLDPPPDSLDVGDTCRVGIPPTVVYVVDVHPSGPDSASRDLRVTRAGDRYTSFPLRPVWTIGPGATPGVEIDFLFRPYAFLEVGDEFADRVGQVWIFEEPWEWRHVYGGSTGVPEWPLVLLTRGDPDRAATIKAKTSAGTHHEEINRWRRLSDTTSAPTPLSSHP